MGEPLTYVYIMLDKLSIISLICIALLNADRLSINRQKGDFVLISKMIILTVAVKSKHLYGAAFIQMQPVHIYSFYKPTFPRPCAKREPQR